MTTNDHPEFHKVELDLPLDVADELIAKAGSVDAAVVHALQEYLKIDYARRDAVIRRISSTGKSVESIARVYAMSTEDITAIING
jgi:Mor family transcriptional regulator